MKFQQQILLSLLLLGVACVASAQTKPLLKRTTYKTDKMDFGVGGTVAVIGAPNGSVRIEGWSNREVEISAEIEVQAETEADLAKLSEITTFATEESLGRIGIISVGTHDKQYLKRLSKKFPKNLVGLPFRIDYVIKVPQYCDLQVDGGKGDLQVTGVEGVMKLNYLETNARIDLVGGGIIATFGSGTANITIPKSSWRGRSADIQLANGTMNVNLPVGLNSEFDAAILRTGKIENGFGDFKPRVRKVEFTEKSIAAKSGLGGTPLKFTVGDGTLRIVQTPKPD